MSTCRGSRARRQGNDVFSLKVVRVFRWCTRSFRSDVAALTGSFFRAAAVGGAQLLSCCSLFGSLLGLASSRNHYADPQNPIRPKPKRKMFHDLMESWMWWSFSSA